MIDIKVQVGSSFLGFNGRRMVLYREYPALQSNRCPAYDGMELGATGGTDTAGDKPRCSTDRDSYIIVALKHSKNWCTCIPEIQEYLLGIIYSKRVCICTCSTKNIQSNHLHQTITLVEDFPQELKNELQRHYPRHKTPPKLRPEARRKRKHHPRSRTPLIVLICIQYSHRPSETESS